MVEENGGVSSGKGGRAAGARNIRVNITKLVSYDDSTIVREFEGVGAFDEFARGFELEGREDRDVQELVLASRDEVSLVSLGVGSQKADKSCMVCAGRDELSRAGCWRGRS